MVQIDFFTLIAQIINFLVLVYLLKRFLYMRIIKAMEDRENMITSRINEAVEKKKDAEREAESFQKKRQELYDKREEILSNAREEGNALREELTGKARTEANEMKARWYEAVGRQKEMFLIDLRRRSARELYTAVNHILKDLANEELERQMIYAFIKRLQKLTDNEKDTIKRIHQKTGHGIIIKSGFDMPEIMKRKLKASVRDHIGDIKLDFETIPDLFCGIELHAQDWQISWSLNSYLDSLEEDMSETLEQLKVQWR